MQPEVQALCLHYIANEWQEIKPVKLRDEPPIPPPWGVWIRLYDPIPNNSGIIVEGVHSIRKVWFLDSHGCQERNPWEYARFIVVNSYCPWAAERFRPQMALWGTVHQIGLAAFALFVGSPNEIYLDMQWGVRWGQGYRMRVGEAGALQVARRLWLS
jgi:hypothetical protein